MIKKKNNRACDLDISDAYQKIKEEFFNDYGYNLGASEHQSETHYNDFCFTKHNNTKEKPKR